MDIDSDSSTDGESEVGDADVCWLCPATESQVAAAMHRATTAAPHAALSSVFQRTAVPIWNEHMHSIWSAAKTSRSTTAAAGINCSTVSSPTNARSRSATPEPLLYNSNHYFPELQSFSTDTCSILVLEQLPCSRLTQMHLQFAADHPPFLVRAAAAVARFTALQQLYISPSDSAAVTLQENFKLDCLMPSLAGLSDLRSLVFEQLSSPSCLRFLPPQLQELSVGLQMPPAPGQIQLGHVTALTRLSLSSSPYNYWWDRKCVIDVGDVLPSNLQVLRLKDCGGVQPLLHLQQLASLEISNCTTAAAQLEQLSSLGSLQQLSLTCFGDTGVQNCAAAWSALRSLSLYLYMDGKEIQHHVMQQLSMAHGLMSLSLANFLVAARDFAAVLLGLTSLTSLSLEHGCWLMGATVVTPNAGSTAGAVAMHCGCGDAEKGCEAGPVVCAICTLPKLQSLRCVWVPFGTAAVQQLQQAAHHLVGGCILDYCG